jgi:formiminotetrahydrofolate cyclodeaminase
MVAGLPKTRTGAPEEAADLAEASARLRPLRDSLVSLVDRDSEAYAAVLAAFKLPKTSDAEKAFRREAIDAAMRGATDVPLETMRACQQALRGGVIVAQNALLTARSDVGTALELLIAAVRGSALNIDANVASVRDADYVRRTIMEREQLAADSETDADEGRRYLTARASTEKENSNGYS